MISRTAVVTQAGTVGPSTPDRANWYGFVPLLLVSAWSGLIAGLLEVATIVVWKQLVDPIQIYRISRHFVSLIPLSNLAVFLTLGFLGCGVVLVWPHHGRRVFARVLGALVVLPSFLVAFPRIYSLALFVVALGMTTRVVPLLERANRGFRRFVLISFPAAVVIVPVLGALLWVGDLKKQRRENERPLPPPGSPNVLLIVLDTVAASHLSLYGYDRPTCATLIELADRGVRFDRARSPSSSTVVPDPARRDDGDLPMWRSPQVAVKDTNWSYIRREGDGREKLFHLSEDPKEEHDLAGDPSAQAILAQMRGALKQFMGGPLVRGRLHR